MYIYVVPVARQCLVLGPDPKYFMPMTVAKHFIDFAPTACLCSVVLDFTCYCTCFIVPHQEAQQQQHGGVL